MKILPILLLTTKLAWGSFYSNAGSFAQATSTGNQAVTGIGFQGKAIIFWMTGQTGDASAADEQWAYGVAVSSTGRWYIAGTGQSGGTNHAASYAYKATKCIGLLTPASATLKAEADFVSFDSDGFTINWTTADSTARIVNYLVVGGTDLTNAAAGYWTTPASTGNQAITGVGFQPNFVLIGTQARTTALPAASTGSAEFGLGVATDSGHRGDIITYTRGTGGNQAKSVQRTIYATQGLTDYSALRFSADFVSFDPDGFTLNYATTASGYYEFYLVLKGPAAFVGSFNQATSTGNQAVTGVGFQGSAILAFSRNLAAGTGIGAVSRHSLGAATSATARITSWTGASDASSPVSASQDLDRTKLLKMMTPGGASPTTEAAMDFVSFDPDGFTINNTTADATSREVIYVVFGAGAAGPAIRPGELHFRTEEEWIGRQPVDFTFVQIPDPHPTMPAIAWVTETNWIVDNQAAQNIQAVLSTGDVGPYITWSDAWTAGWSKIDALGVPYLTANGNHDYTDDVPANRVTNGTDSFDAQLGYTRINGKSWFVGYHNATNNKSNEAIEFVVGNYKFLVVALEFFPRAAAVSWAADVINAHPHDYVIIVTHGLLNADGEYNPETAATFTADGDTYGPDYYSLPHGTPGPDNYSGADLYDWAKQFPNLRLMLCGHNLNPAAEYQHRHGYRLDYGTNGNRVYSIYTNYQDVGSGSERGLGWILMLKFKPSISKIEVSNLRTYEATNPPTYYCVSGCGNTCWPTYQIQLDPAP